MKKNDDGTFNLNEAEINSILGLLKEEFESYTEYNNFMKLTKDLKTAEGITPSDQKNQSANEGSKNQFTFDELTAAMNAIEACKSNRNLGQVYFDNNVSFLQKAKNICENLYDNENVVLENLLIAINELSQMRECCDNKQAAFYKLLDQVSKVTQLWHKLYSYLSAPNAKMPKRWQKK